ncbi:hypothetical protein COCON_G00058360 [Conger conger]|uniref:Uncharacterized protein n=1 Tax=Conger conger TaxID=82655 RepID=A0A9Q1DQX4_CONCO|nr:hypothetical protein COCON_G00058360 [Conger conger]
MEAPSFTSASERPPVSFLALIGSPCVTDVPNQPPTLGEAQRLPYGGKGTHAHRVSFIKRPSVRYHIHPSSPRRRRRSVPPLGHQGEPGDPSPPRPTAAAWQRFFFFGPARRSALIRGVCFLCLVDVVPVKNEDGLVIMFILNFEVMTDERVRDPSRTLNHKLSLPWLSAGRPRGFKLRLPLLRSLSNSKQSLQEDPEAGRGREPSHPSHESLALDDLPPAPGPEDPRLGPPPPTWAPEDQRTLLLEASPRLGLPLTQSSPRPHRLNPDASVSNCSLTHSRSRESFHSMRRASSVDDIEAMRPDWDRRRTRPGSTGAVNHKSNILNSTSDSDLMRYRTISKIPQITLNFVDFKPDPLIALPAGEMDIIAPCKLIDRTHNVTEKVTQPALGQHILRFDSIIVIPHTLLGRSAVSVYIGRAQVRPRNRSTYASKKPPLPRETQNCPVLHFVRRT